MVNCFLTLVYQVTYDYREAPQLSTISKPCTGLDKPRWLTSISIFGMSANNPVAIYSVHFSSNFLLLPIPSVTYSDGSMRDMAKARVNPVIVL